MKTFRWIGLALAGQLVICLVLYACAPLFHSETVPSVALPGDDAPVIEEPSELPQAIAAPTVLSTTAMEGADTPAETDAQIERAPDGSRVDLMIENGHVHITGDGGASWLAVPVLPGTLQDYWLPYLRMGEQSYYADEEIALVAALGEDGQPHLYVGDRLGSWQDVCYTLDQQVLQMSIARDTDGTFRLLMVTQGGFVTLGSSRDAYEWTFTQPAYFADAASSSSTMNIYGASLMRDGTILMVTWKLDCAISTDGGQHFTYLLQDHMGIDPMETSDRISTSQLPYEDEAGRYCVEMSDGSSLVSTDGEHWERSQ